MTFISPIHKRNGCNDAILSITGLNLGAPADLTIDEAVTLKDGVNNALYRARAAGVYNYWFDGSPEHISYMDPADFTAVVQMAIDGDVEGAKNIVDAANNQGCPIDAFGRYTR